jgi:hypothetical protein
MEEVVTWSAAPPQLGVRVHHASECCIIHTSNTHRTTLGDQKFCL